MTDRDRVRLLHGPYAPPPLRKGDRAHCLLRDCTVVIYRAEADRGSSTRGCHGAQRQAAAGTHGRVRPSGTLAREGGSPSNTPASSAAAR